MDEEIEVDYEGDEDEEQATVSDTAHGEDVYGDLFGDQGEEGTLLKARYAGLQERCHAQAVAMTELKQQLQETIAERDRLQAERKILVRNISCIFRTAQEELSRKDKEIKSLRKLSEASSRGTDSAVHDRALPAPPNSDNRTNPAISANQ